MKKLLPYNTKVNRNTYNEDIVIHFFLFISWPFISFIFALKNFNQPKAKYFIILFFGLFGYTFFINSNSGADSIRYAQTFIDFSNSSYLELHTILSSFNYDSGSSFDIVIPLLSFSLSKITNNWHILFAVYAILYGYFNIKCISLMYNLYLTKANYNSLLYFLFFLLIAPIYEINGIRYYLATWIFFYGAYYVVIYEKNIYLIIALFSCLVHFSYFSVNMILIVFVILGKKNIVYYPLLISSFILPKNSEELIRNIVDQLPFGLSMHVNEYSKNINSISYLSDNVTVLVSSYVTSFFYWFLIVSVFLTMYKLRFIIKENKYLRLYSFLLLLLSFVNYISIVPSGERFNSIFQLFSIAFLLNIYTKYSSLKTNILLYSGTPLFLISALFQFRYLSEFLNMTLFLPFPLFFQNREINYPAFNLFFQWLH